MSQALEKGAVFRERILAKMAQRVSSIVTSPTEVGSAKEKSTVGDVVISKENEGTRNKWPLGRVVQTYPSEDGFVRKVRFLMADGDLDDRGKRQSPPSYLDRPIHKLVLLLTAGEVVEEDVLHRETREVPIEEPTKNT